jgi:hypothetical protein
MGKHKPLSLDTHKYRTTFTSTTKLVLRSSTNDSDIPIVADDDFIAIKEYTRDGKFTIVSTSKATIKNAIAFLGNESLDRLVLKDAVCPLFENVKSRNLRALMMVALGCDVYKTGIVGTGPKTLEKIIVKLKENITVVEGQDKEELLFGALLKHTESLSVNILTVVLDPPKNSYPLK